MAYTIQIDFGSGYTTYDAIANSVTINEILHKNLNPADNDARFSLVPDTALYNLLRGMTSSDKIKCKIYNESTVLFFGYVLKDYSISKTFKIEPVSIQLVSPTNFLKKKIPNIVFYSSIKVSDANTANASLVKNILALAGYANADIIIPTINYILPSVLIEENTQTYFDVISKALFEYGYILDFDKDGKTTTYELFPASVTATGAFDSTNIRNSITQKVKLEEYEKVSIKYPVVKTINNAIIFQDKTNGTVASDCVLTLQPNTYLTASSDPTETEWYANYDYAEGEILSATSVTTSIVKHGDINLLVFTPSYKKALISLKNTSATLARDITQLRLKGNIVIKTGETFSMLQRVGGTDLVKDYETSYIYDKTAADALCSKLNNYYLYSDFNYYLDSFTNYSIGTIVTITEMNISATGRIIEKKYNVISNTISYVIEAIADYVVSYPTTETNTTSTGSSTQIINVITPVQLGLNIDGTLVKPIDSNTMVADITPTGAGLYLTKTYIGLRDGTDWKVFIKSDGTFKFTGTADNYLEYNGTNLELKGKILATSGTIGGINLNSSKLYVGTGTVNSSDTAFYLDSSGNFSLKDKLYWNGTSLAITGAITATSGSFTGTISTSNITATGGSIGGWVLSSTLLTSRVAGTGAGMSMDKTLSRFSMFDSSNIEKVAMGYLSGLAKNGAPFDLLKTYVLNDLVYYSTSVYRCKLAGCPVGTLPTNTTYWEVSTLTYSSSDYGFWVKPGNSVVFDGGIAFSNGDMIATDGSMKIKSGATEVLRLGTSNGKVGLHFTSAMNQGITSYGVYTQIYTPSGYINIGAGNATYAHIDTDRSLFYFYKGLVINGDITFTNANVASVVDISATAAGTKGRALYIKGGYTGVDATARSIAGGDLYLNSGLSVGTNGSAIYFQTPTPAGASGTSLNSYATRLLMNDAGVSIQTDGVNADSNTVYIKDASGYLKGRTIQNGVWSYNYNQNLSTTNTVTFAGITNIGDVTVIATNGKGIKFWNNNAYGIWMSDATDITYGGRISGDTTSDYNMYFRMGSGTNRGFVFESVYATKLFAIQPTGVRTSLPISSSSTISGSSLNCVNGDMSSSGIICGSESSSHGAVFLRSATGSNYATAQIELKSATNAGGVAHLAFTHYNSGTSAYINSTQIRLNPTDNATLEVINNDGSAYADILARTFYLSTGFRLAGYLDSTAVQDTVEFPLGATVSVYVTALVNRNATIAPRLGSNTGQYTTGGTGTLLTGTWKACGNTGTATGTVLARRTL